MKAKTSFLRFFQAINHIFSNCLSADVNLCPLLSEIPVTPYLVNVSIAPSHTISQLLNIAPTEDFSQSFILKYQIACSCSITTYDIATCLKCFIYHSSPAIIYAWQDEDVCLLHIGRNFCLRLSTQKWILSFNFNFRISFSNGMRKGPSPM